MNCNCKRGFKLIKRPNSSNRTINILKIVWAHQHSASLKLWLPTRRMRAQIHSWAETMTNYLWEWDNMPKLMLTPKESVDLPSTCGSRLWRQRVMTALGRFLIWRLQRISWLVRDTKIGFLVSISTQLVRILSLAAVIEVSNYGTLLTQASRILSKMFRVDLCGNVNSMIPETLCWQQRTTEPLNFLICMQQNWDNSIANTLIV